MNFAQSKTTLVYQVCHHRKKVVERFAAHRAWVDVSQTYEIRNALRKLIQQLKSQKDFEMGNTETRDLIEEVRNCLQENRRLTDFDDVWATGFWDEIKKILPSEQNGSSIIITTRKNEAEEPFTRIAFHGDECPQDLRLLSDEIIDKCKGLPLAITTIGSLLSKTNIDNDDVSTKWQNVHKNLSRLLANDTDAGRVLNTVMSESYYDLPYHLKRCFLCLGEFPEDYPINCNRLIRLWIAVGFVKENPERPEEIGRKHLQELINRSLIQATVVDCDGKVRSCRVHDMMRGFILQKFEEMNFCQLFDDAGSSDLNSSDSPRRSSIQKDYRENELQGVISDPGKTLPASIGKLQNLLTLHIKNSCEHRLSGEINKLAKLRQLLCYSFHGGEIDLGMAAFSYRGLQIIKGFGKFKDLQMLYSIDCYHVNASIFIELRKLKQLKKLGITRLRRHNGRDLYSRVFNRLTSLWIGAVDENEFLELDSLTNPPRHLERLYLEGRLQSLPKWIPRLKKLVKLCFYGSGITDDPIDSVKRLE
ncbi:disease resistance protein RPM1-like [Prosopis cineraria]|uniref:disease resistance protein RPM1-like n=1 Tax=Prosopis cineraria TaxID=364024 RepID=UPI00240EAE65|nr:disease resistance protein RPM1-like [Prosopis cineraria]